MRFAIRYYLNLEKGATLHLKNIDLMLIHPWYRKVIIYTV